MVGGSYRKRKTDPAAEDQPRHATFFLSHREYLALLDRVHSRQIRTFCAGFALAWVLAAALYVSVALWAVTR